MIRFIVLLILFVCKATMGFTAAALAAGINDASTPETTSTTSAMIAVLKSTSGAPKNPALPPLASSIFAIDLDQQRADHQAAVAGDRGDEQRLLHDHRDDGGGRGAQCLAQADLAGSFLHHDQHDVAHAHGAREDRADRRPSS